MYRETFENKHHTISVNKDSVETTSYLHKQDLISAFLIPVSTFRGLRELSGKLIILPNTSYVHRLRKLKIKNLMFLQY